MCRRVLKLCDQEIPEPQHDQLALAVTQAQAVESPLRPTTHETEEAPQPPATLCAQRWGFSLHAGLFAAAKDRKKLENLTR